MAYFPAMHQLDYHEPNILHRCPMLVFHPKDEQKQCQSLSSFTV